MDTIAPPHRGRNAGVIGAGCDSAIPRSDQGGAARRWYMRACQVVASRSLDMPGNCLQTVAHCELCFAIRYKSRSIPSQESSRMLEICPLSALPRGEARRVEADPPIAVFHTDDGEVFAVDDTCTHQDASLADGWLEGCEIECPLHASRFDLRTGAVDAPPAKLPIRTHEVVIVDGVVNVVLDDAPPNLPPGVTTRAGEAAP